MSLNKLVTTNIKNLSTAQVRELQSLLNKCGYQLDVDGIIGPLTTKAFNDFKRKHKLTHPDLIGETTLTWLNRYANQTKQFRQVNQRGLNLIKEFEGLRLNAYLCPAGVWTIGYGSTFYPDGRRVRQGDKITQQEADQLFLATVKPFAKVVDQAVKVTINNNQFSALVSFAFNVGTGAFKSSTLLRLLNRSDYQGAADQLLRWNRAGNQILVGLTRRRRAERALFLG
ncbi:phage lysozyme [Cyanobacterium sp. HL-69]|uniref:glycoside hydrolase family protein n=1 Tax=Cyanobacterium sp. HL-69 TaxID=2054282 RepID=UPI000CA39E7C|nr:phage lysozyme [Cyanobacterium sp. HL-69]